MAWRTAHGTAREYGRLTVSEVAPSDELAAASPAATGAIDRDAAGRFLPGNRIGVSKRHRPGNQGALGALLRQGDAASRSAIAFGQRYAAHRRRELAAAHGGSISAGVGAMVESAGEALASARYWQARSMAEGSADAARLAAQCMAQHRQAERDAWELASREAKARPLAARDVPWLTQPAQTSIAAPTSYGDGVSGSTPGEGASGNENDSEGASGPGNRVSRK